MKTPAHDTALFLAALTGFGSFGGSASWSVYVRREPLAPVNVVTVYDTGGGPAVLIPKLRRPSVQVRVRASSYDAGWQKANAAYEALVTPTQTAVTDGVVLSWIAAGDVNYIGWDDKDRSLFTVNFSVLRDGSAS